MRTVLVTVGMLAALSGCWKDAARSARAPSQPDRAVTVPGPSGTAATREAKPQIKLPAVTPQELKALEGRWVLDRVERDGRPVTASGTLEITGERYTMVWNGVLETGTHTFGPEPGAVNVRPADGLRKGTTLHGLFKREGDTYTACYGPGYRERPTDFSPHNGYVYVWKRAAN